MHPPKQHPTGQAMRNEGETLGDRKEKASRHGGDKRRMQKTAAARLTPEEYAAVLERAARAGLSLSAFARHCLLGDPGPRAKRRPPVEIQLLGKAVAELNKVGSNINQIAKALNSGHRVLLPEVRKAAEELSIALTAVIQATGKG